MESSLPYIWPKRIVPDDILSMRPVDKPRVAFITGATG